MSFSHLSRQVRQVTGKTFARKFITLGKVMTFWPDIVGAQLASKTYPIGMNVRKTGAQNKSARKLEAILEVAASSADAALLHYQKGLILERLKNMLGDTIVVDMKVTHGAPRLDVAAAVETAPPHLTGSQKTCLSKGVEDVRDPELRAALENLGRWLST
jgi:hypothetical protein